MEYEVDMDEITGEILVGNIKNGWLPQSTQAFNGFFAHMFQDLYGYAPLSKYTILILDVSFELSLLYI